VSVPGFLIYFLKFLKKLKILLKKLKICHVCQANVMPHVTIMLVVVSSFSIWSLYFYFYLNLVPMFIKIVQFRRSPS